MNLRPKDNYVTPTRLKPGQWLCRCGSDVWRVVHCDGECATVKRGREQLTVPCGSPWWIGVHYWSPEHRRQLPRTSVEGN